MSTQVLIINPVIQNLRCYTNYYLVGWARVKKGISNHLLEGRALVEISAVFFGHLWEIDRIPLILRRSGVSFLLLSGYLGSGWLLTPFIGGLGGIVGGTKSKVE